MTSATISNHPSVLLHCRVERRADGAILVRVPSTGQFGQPLPDAVFAFRAGAPQYSKWARELEMSADHGQQA